MRDALRKRRTSVSPRPAEPIEAVFEMRGPIYRALGFLRQPNILNARTANIYKKNVNFVNFIKRQRDTEKSELRSI